jgi:hypothetical protein
MFVLSGRRACIPLVTVKLPCQRGARKHIAAQVTCAFALRQIDQVSWLADMGEVAVGSKNDNALVRGGPGGLAPPRLAGSAPSRLPGSART